MMISRMPSSSAQDRQVSVWFNKVESGEIKLPRFQRPQSWERNRVRSLLETVIKNLPLGITLLLNVDKEQFVSRYLVTAPETGNRVTEHLLDGQQRLTALWRALHNNYTDVKYFIYLSQFDCNSSQNKEQEEFHVWYTARWNNKNGRLMPVWADLPKECFNRGLIPMDLFMPGDISSKYESWINEAVASSKPQVGADNYEDVLFSWMNHKNDILSIIRDFRETISHYNLPYLELPSQTSKETALDVFINMNTNSKPLSQYDIIRAEIEGVKDISLDDYQNDFNEKHPNVKFYFELPFLILASSALIQDKMPNQKGMWDMKKDLMIDNWGKMTDGLAKMALFMESQGVFDKSRLPTNAVLSVIAALYTYIPENLDARGKSEVILRKYLWSSFFTDRYENSAATHAYNDFIALKKIILGETKNNGDYWNENDVPVLNRQNYPLSTVDELIRVSWPKRENIRARAIMSVFSKLGAVDFADGSQLSRQQLVEGKRHYHHIFPDNILKQADIESYLALNCALITDKTNLNISNKEPLKYLTERYSWTSEYIVNTRLKSHLIPINELKNGGYEGLNEEDRNNKLRVDFDAFIRKRADYVVRAVDLLVEGKEITANDIINQIERSVLV